MDEHIVYGFDGFHSSICIKCSTHSSYISYPYSIVYPLPQNKEIWKTYNIQFGFLHARCYMDWFFIKSTYIIKIVVQVLFMHRYQPEEMCVFRKCQVDMQGSLA